MPLSTDFLNNPQNFCQHHAIRMAGSTNEAAKLPDPTFALGAWNNAGSYYPVAAGGAGNVNLGYDVAANAVNVCWIDVGDNQVRLFIQGSNDQLVAAGNGTVFADWFPAYFLPWGAGKIGRMRLPAQPAATVPVPVRAFFTAEMNGCSFVVGGSKKSPVVAHYNVANPTGALTQNQKDQTQIAMVKATLTPGGVVPNVGGKRVNALRWVPNTYNADATTGATIANNPMTPYDALGAEVTTVENNVRTGLLAHNQKPVPGPANPNGIISNIRVAMMGVLDPGTRDWRFFYQRNFYTQTNYKDKLGWTGGMQKKLGMDHRQVQTQVKHLLINGWEYTELWPNGPGVMRMPGHGNPNI